MYGLSLSVVLFADFYSTLPSLEPGETSQQTTRKCNCEFPGYLYQSDVVGHYPTEIKITAQVMVVVCI